MSSQSIHPAKSLKGEITVPGDKSISHRALIFASIAEGKSTIQNLLLGEDVLGTMRILQQLGVKMSHRPEELREGDVLTIEGSGLQSLKEPKDVLDCGNSGTTMRLLLGLLAAQPFEATLTGDPSLNKRPMDRVIEPLQKMGASFQIQQKSGRRLIVVKGSPKPQGIDYTLPVASAQLKSALLIAGLFAESKTVVRQRAASRDHTERLLQSLGANLKQSDQEIILQPAESLAPFNISVPGDFSSAAFFIVAGLLMPRSSLIIKNVGLNPTRSALLDVLGEMGASIEIQNKKNVSGEPMGDVLVRSSSLKAASIGGNIIPNLIDEIPIFSVAAAISEGKSQISDASELRVKESDRIAALSEELKKLGVVVEELKDGMNIFGGSTFHAGNFKSHGDHRIAMSLSIAALKADGPSVIEDVDCVSTSFPNFFKLLAGVSHK